MQSLMFELNLKFFVFLLFFCVLVANNKKNFTAISEKNGRKEKKIFFLFS